MFVYKWIYCHDAPVRPQDPLRQCISDAVVDGFVSRTDEELVLRDKETKERSETVWLKERCSESKTKAVFTLVKNN